MPRALRRTTRRSALAGLAALGLAPGPAGRAATPYPERPIVLVAPFSAGGAADIAARTLAAHVGRHLPNPAASITVENRPGASGAVGTLHVQRAAPDGGTLLLARVASAAILPAMDWRTPYAWDAFTMLGLLDESPVVIAVRSDAPWRSLRDLVVALRERPGTLHFATTGPATILDLGVRQLFAAAGLPIDAGIAVPFRGGGEAVEAVITGAAQFVGSNLSDASAALADGRLRALVVGTAEPLPALPGVPTARQAEVPDLGGITGWNALFGPPGMDEAAVDAWIAALAALRADAAWRAATLAVGSLPRLLGPVETRRFVEAQVALYADLARRLGLT